MCVRNGVGSFFCSFSYRSISSFVPSVLMKSRANDLLPSYVESDLNSFFSVQRMPFCLTDPSAYQDSFLPTIVLAP